MRRSHRRLRPYIHADIDRQLGLEDLVIGAGETRGLDPRRHGEADAPEHGELGRLQIEPPADEIEKLRLRLVVPARARRRRCRGLALEDLGLLARSGAR